MDAEKYFKDLVAQSKAGKGASVCSVCSSNRLVIEAALEEGMRLGRPVLVEATANQINQFGGYMGLTPALFRRYVLDIAKKLSFDPEMLLLGGDHLGPLVWKNEPAEEAMAKAKELIRQFAAAGFVKIHLDCSMPLAGEEPGRNFSVATVAARAAELCAVAEEAAPGRPVYVVGSEVPIPGGATDAEESLTVTRSEDLLEQAEAFRSAFLSRGLEDAYQRVIAIVVQPGVEFGDDQIFPYDREKAAGLVQTARHIEGLALEGHSTDYQPRNCLRQMAEDGIVIQKVGPALTFALRSAYFALEEIERLLYPLEPEGGYSRFAQALEEEMLASPANWNRYYRGDAHTLALMRRYSLSDRCRYYLQNEKVAAAGERLIRNIDRAVLPQGLLRQYLPRQAERLAAGEIDCSAEAFLKEAVKICLRDYTNTGV